jgi:CheY-like chemotaxis protein
MEGATVVIVDDQADSRELLAILLEGCGAYVVQCDGAETALQALNTSGVQLLVADIAMPDIDGYQLIERVRRRDTALPAIAVSAYARPEDRARALAAGYNAYCVKPLDGPELLRTISGVLGRAGAPMQ